MTKDIFNFENEIHDSFNKIINEFNNIMNLFKKQLDETISNIINENQNKQVINDSVEKNINKAKISLDHGLLLLKNTINSDLDSKETINQINNIIELIDFEKTNNNSNTEFNKIDIEVQSKSPIDDNEVQNQNFDNDDNFEKINSVGEISNNIDNDEINLTEEIKNLAIDNPTVEYNNFKSNFKLAIKSYRSFNNLANNKIKDEINNHITAISFINYRLLNRLNVSNIFQILNREASQDRIISDSNLIYPFISFEKFISDALNIEITQFNAHSCMNKILSVITCNYHKKLIKYDRRFKYNLKLTPTISHNFPGTISAHYMSNGLIIPIINNKYMTWLLTSWGFIHFCKKFLEINDSLPSKINSEFKSYMTAPTYKVNFYEINPQLSEDLNIEKLNISSNIVYYIKNRT